MIRVCFYFSRQSFYTCHLYFVCFLLSWHWYSFLCDFPALLVSFVIISKPFWHCFFYSRPFCHFLVILDVFYSILPWCPLYIYATLSKFCVCFFIFIVYVPSRPTLSGIILLIRVLCQYRTPFFGEPPTPNSHLP